MAYKNLATATGAVRDSPGHRRVRRCLQHVRLNAQQVGYKFGSVPTASQISAIAGATKIFESAKMKSAETNLEAWAASNCK